MWHVAALGLAATEVSGIDESPLDEQHLLVRVRWAFRFERNTAPPIVEPGAATYLLRRQDSQLQIVFQLDHQDLTRRAQELGLLPRQSYDANGSRLAVLPANRSQSLL